MDTPKKWVLTVATNLHNTQLVLVETTQHIIVIIITRIAVKKSRFLVVAGVMGRVVGCLVGSSGFPLLIRLSMSGGGS